MATSGGPRQARLAPHRRVEGGKKEGGGDMGATFQVAPNGSSLYIIRNDTIGFWYKRLLV